jgi:hypothetical protein
MRTHMPRHLHAKARLLLLTVAAVVAGPLAARAPAESLLRFDAPARHFTESCPLGNGRIGVMVFGGVDEERLVLNESGMWSGSREEADRPDAAKALPEIRRLLLEGRNVEAERLVDEHFTCAKLALWARLGDGNRAYRLLAAQLRLAQVRAASRPRGAGPIRTCSTPIRRSRSTGTSARRAGSRRCCSSRR